MIWFPRKLYAYSWERGKGLEQMLILLEFLILSFNQTLRWGAPFHVATVFHGSLSVNMTHQWRQLCSLPDYLDSSRPFQCYQCPHTRWIYSHTACKSAELKKNSSHSSEMLEDSSVVLKYGASAIIPAEPMCFENNCPPLTYFVVYGIRQTAVVHGIRAWTGKPMESPVFPRKLRRLC